MQHYYHAVAATAMRSNSTSDKVIREVAKAIKKEIKQIVSLDYDYFTGH